MESVMFQIAALDVKYKTFGTETVNAQPYQAAN